MNFSVDVNYATTQNISTTLSIAKYTSIASYLHNIFLYAKYADLIADFIRLIANCFK